MNVRHSFLLIPVLLPLVISGTLLLYSLSYGGSSRIKDLCSFQDKQETDLIGYGLVIGLDGTGDGNGSQFTARSVANMMERLGLTVDPTKLKIKNIAAVLVTGRLSSQYAEGAYFDVTISSIGDASSLQGGTLVLTQLADASGIVRATAQGSVSIGGFNVQVDEGNRIVNNYTLVGRIPSGGKVVTPVEVNPLHVRQFNLSLREPDLNTANRIAERINLRYGTTAYAIDGGTVTVQVPDSVMDPTLRPRFLAEIAQLQVVPDNVARIVINERTGTIVAGKFVSIEPVAIAHGTITVSIQSRPVISQPDPLSRGETISTTEPTIVVDQQQARVVELAESVNLADIASALNKIGATPRDIVAIFQALKQAGALRAELVIL